MLMLFVVKLWIFCVLCVDAVVGCVAGYGDGEGGGIAMNPVRAANRSISYNTANTHYTRVDTNGGDPSQAFHDLDDHADGIDVDPNRSARPYFSPNSARYRVPEHKPLPVFSFESPRYLLQKGQRPQFRPQDPTFDPNYDINEPPPAAGFAETGYADGGYAETGYAETGYAEGYDDMQHAMPVDDYPTRAVASPRQPRVKRPPLDPAEEEFMLQAALTNSRLADNDQNTSINKSNMRY